MFTEKTLRKPQIGNVAVAGILIAVLAFFVLFFWLAPFSQATEDCEIEGECLNMFDRDMGGYCHAFSGGTCDGNAVQDDCAPGFTVYPFNPSAERHYPYGDLNRCDYCDPPAVAQCDAGLGGPPIECCSCHKQVSWPYSVYTCEAVGGHGCVSDFDSDRMEKISTDPLLGGHYYCRWDSSYWSPYELEQYCSNRSFCVRCKDGFVWNDNLHICEEEGVPCPPSPCIYEGQMCFPNNNAIMECYMGIDGCYVISRILYCGENQPQYCSNANCYDCVPDATGDGSCFSGCEKVDVDCNCEPNGKCGVGCTVEEDPDCGTPCNPGSCDGICASGCSNDPDCCIHNDDICCEICSNDNDCTDYVLNYDPTGNLIATTDFDEGESVYYDYDPFNRLIGFSKTGHEAFYFYDYQGRRVKKIDSLKREITYYVYNGNDVLLEESFVCGDVTGDETVNIADVVHLIGYLFQGFKPPDPLWIGDANEDGNVNSADAVYLINYLFLGGMPPCRNLFEGLSPPEPGSGGTGSMGLTSGDKNRDGSVNLWIEGSFDADVSGFEFEIVYDSNKLEIYDVTTTELTSDMDIYEKESGGRKIIAVFDQTDGNHVPAGSSGKLVSFKAKGVGFQQMDLSSLKLERVDVFAKETTTTLSITILKNDFSSIEQVTELPPIRSVGTRIGGLLTAISSNVATVWINLINLFTFS